MPDYTVLREFEYRPNRVTTLLFLILASAGVGLSCYFALYADRVANVRGIKLTPDHVRVLAMVIAILGTIGLISLASLLVSSFTQRRRIAFTADSIIVPKPRRVGISSREIEIPYDEIVHVHHQDFVGNCRFLRITHKMGTVGLPSIMFPSRQNFDIVLALTMTGVKHGILDPEMLREDMGAAIGEVKEFSAVVGDTELAKSDIFRSKKLWLGVLLAGVALCLVQNLVGNIVGGMVFSSLCTVVTRYLLRRLSIPLAWFKAFVFLGATGGMVVGAIQEGASGAMGGAVVGGIIGGIVGLVPAGGCWAIRQLSTDTKA